MFVAPVTNPLVTGITNAILPSLAGSFANIRDVEVAPEDLNRLKALHKERAILAPNHPTGLDPVVMLWVSRLVGEHFHFLAAREVLVGIKGWYLNQVGAYSVIRGFADRESIRATRKLLAERDHKVVIFPEGEIYEHNDTLLSFQPGVAQMGFWALDDLAKLKKPQTLPLVPVAFKYRLCDSARPAIENSLKAMETALDLEPARITAYERLRRIAERMLDTLEREVGIKPEAERTLPQRIADYRKVFTARLARSIGVELDPEVTAADQLHDLFFALRSWVGELPEDHHSYDVRRYRRRLEVAAPLFAELLRFQNFIAVTGDYIAQNPTAERFMEILGRMEKELFGEIRNFVPRVAMVRIAPPIRLEERREEYRENKRETVKTVTLELEGQIRQMLQELSTNGTPLALDS
jgi:hypothetical protein